MKNNNINKAHFMHLEYDKDLQVYGEPQVCGTPFEYFIVSDFIVS